MGDGLFKRGKIWWIRTDPLTGTAQSTKRRGKAEARAEYERRLRLSQDPTYEPEESGPAKTLNEWAVMLVEQKEALRAAGTASYYAKKLGHIVRIFGAESMLDAAFKPRRFDAYVAQRRAEKARSTTILKEIGVAKVLAKFAARQGGFRGNTDLFKPSDLTNDYEPGTRFLLPEELVLLLAALSEKRRAHVALCVAIGPRYSEAFRVLPEYVNVDAWTVYVPGTKTKTSKDTIPIAEPFRPLLLAALPYLPLEPWLQMTRDLERACKRAGIPKVTSNDLRRTHGSWLIEAGVADSLVSRVLRHANERMVRTTYGRSRPEKLGAAISAQIAVTTARQLPAKEASEAAKTPENAEETPPAGPTVKRIENPRVGGSIPSRDTAKSLDHSEDPNDDECQCVPGSAEKCRACCNRTVTKSESDTDFEAERARKIERLAELDPEGYAAPAAVLRGLAAAKAPAALAGDLEAVERELAAGAEALLGGRRG